MKRPKHIVVISILLAALILVLPVYNWITYKNSNKKANETMDQPTNKIHKASRYYMVPVINKGNEILFEYDNKTKRLKQYNGRIKDAARMQPYSTDKTTNENSFNMNEPMQVVYKSPNDRYALLGIYTDEFTCEHFFANLENKKTTRILADDDPVYDVKWSAKGDKFLVNHPFGASNSTYDVFVIRDRNPIYTGFENAKQYYEFMPEEYNGHRHVNTAMWTDNNNGTAVIEMDGNYSYDKKFSYIIWFNVLVEDNFDVSNNGIVSGTKRVKEWDIKGHYSVSTEEGCNNDFSIDSSSPIEEINGIKKELRKYKCQNIICAIDTLINGFKRVHSVR